MAGCLVHATFQADAKSRSYGYVDWWGLMWGLESSVTVCYYVCLSVLSVDLCLCCGVCAIFIFCGEEGKVS